MHARRQLAGRQGAPVRRRRQRDRLLEPGLRLRLLLPELLPVRVHVRQRARSEGRELSAAADGDRARHRCHRPARLLRRRAARARAATSSGAWCGSRRSGADRPWTRPALPGDHRRSARRIFAAVDSRGGPPRSDLQLRRAELHTVVVDAADPDRAVHGPRRGPAARGGSARGPQLPDPAGGIERAVRGRAALAAERGDADPAAEPVRDREGVRVSHGARVSGSVRAVRDQRRSSSPTNRSGATPEFVFRKVTRGGGGDRRRASATRCRSETSTPSATGATAPEYAAFAIALLDLDARTTSSSRPASRTPCATSSPRPSAWSASTGRSTFASTPAWSGAARRFRSSATPRKLKRIAGTRARGQVRFRAAPAAGERPARARPRRPVRGAIGVGVALTGDGSGVWDAPSGRTRISAANLPISRLATRRVPERATAGDLVTQPSSNSMQKVAFMAVPWHIFSPDAERPYPRTTRLFPMAAAPAEDRLSIVLGVNAYHGDSAACIVVDGKLVAAAEEERFRRIKHWAGFPSRVHPLLPERGPRAPLRRERAGHQQRSQGRATRADRVPAAEAAEPLLRAPAGANAPQAAEPRGRPRRGVPGETLPRHDRARRASRRAPRVGVLPVALGRSGGRLRRRLRRLLQRRLGAGAHRTASRSTGAFISRTRSASSTRR